MIDYFEMKNNNNNNNNNVTKLIYVVFIDLNLNNTITTAMFIVNLIHVVLCEGHQIS